MIFNVDNLKELDIILSENLDYKDFAVTSLNHKNDMPYACENDHTGAEAALLVDSSSYNPNDGRFSMQGIVVYICPRCKKPVFENDDYPEQLPH